LFDLEAGAASSVTGYTLVFGLEFYGARGWGKELPRLILSDLTNKNIRHRPLRNQYTTRTPQQPRLETLSHLLAKWPSHAIADISRAVLHQVN